MDNQKQGTSKRWYLRWWMISLYVLIFLIIISACTGNKDASPQVQEPAQETDVTQVEPTSDESNVQPDETTTDTVRDEQPIQPSEVFYSIVSVTDGDTFKVSIDGKTETVRLIGIDTPETVDPRKPVQCFGTEASRRAKELLTNKKVKLVSDPTQDNRDKYSRLLRYAWLEDGTFFNKQMISDGFAVEYTYQIPYQYQMEFKQAEAEARTAKRGLWADNACPAGTPTNTNTSTPTPTPVPTPTPTPTPQPSGYSCSVAKNCGDMISCEEAYFYLNTCGKSSLDRDKDGIPCESLCS